MRQRAARAPSQSPEPYHCAGIVYANRCSQSGYFLVPYENETLEVVGGENGPAGDLVACRGRGEGSENPNSAL